MFKKSLFARKTVRLMTSGASRLSNCFLANLAVLAIVERTFAEFARVASRGRFGRWIEPNVIRIARSEEGSLDGVDDCSRKRRAEKGNPTRIGK